MKFNGFRVYQKHHINLTVFTWFILNYAIDFSVHGAHWTLNHLFFQRLLKSVVVFVLRIVDFGFDWFFDLIAK